MKTIGIAAFLLLVMSCPLLADSAEESHQTPNIILLVMDNFGYGEVGVYGGGVLRGAATPNIDSIADDGLQLTNFNVEAECTPSRSALMTGRYGIRTRQRPNAAPRDIWYGITEWEITLAEMLSAAGYKTGIFGKWHLGDTAGRYPTDQGFDEWYGIANSSDQAFWADSDSFQADAGVQLPRIMTALRDQKPQQKEVFDRAKRSTIDREITDHAIDFIRRRAEADEPFFAYVPYTQTHEPVDAHPDFKGKTGNGSFADVLAQTDAYVGEILTALTDLGLGKETIVVFTA
ncbi:MAG: sulfatase-like hydrolase/transferase, partial [Porticoccaceae bacterium]|nr:sulfatase-like hydrolase/transferase [Porticoccaceae bacterium]